MSAKYHDGKGRRYRHPLVDCHICGRPTYNWSYYTIRFATGPDQDIEICWQCEIDLGEEE